MKISEIYEIINEIAPFSSQSEWDNSGLIIGSMNTDVKKAGFALDATPEVINDAKKKGCQLIITHHPVIFNPVSSLSETDPAYLAIKNGIAVISVHTPFDKSEPGVNTVLASLLGLKDIKIMDTDEEGLCRVGTLERPLSSKEFAQAIAKALGGGVTYSARSGKIKKVAVCGGAAGEFYEAALASGAQAFVTGEAKHHHFLGARQTNIALFAAGHFETEAPAMKVLKDIMQKKTGIDCVMLVQKKTTEFTGAI